MLEHKEPQIPYLGIRGFFMLSPQSHWLPGLSGTWDKIMLWWWSWLPRNGRDYIGFLISGDLCSAVTLSSWAWSGMCICTSILNSNRDWEIIPRAAPVHEPTSFCIIRDLNVVLYRWAFQGLVIKFWFRNIYLYIGKI